MENVTYNSQKPQHIADGLVDCTSLLNMFEIPFVSYVPTPGHMGTKSCHLAAYPELSSGYDLITGQVLKNLPKKGYMTLLHLEMHKCCI